MPARVIALGCAITMLGALLLGPGRAHATPPQDLAKAREVFQMGDFEAAIPLFNILLYPSVRLAESPDIVEAHVFLGAAYFELGRLDDARREFEHALRLDENVELLDVIFSPEAIGFFQEVREDFREAARAAAERMRVLTAEDLVRQRLASIIVIERQPYFINFVPFGAGQFQNSHKKKGVFFLAAEGAICGASLTLWSIQVGKYGFNGKVPLDEVSSVRTMQQWQVAAGVGCLVIMGAGIADALINYQSATRLPADESLLPDDLRLDKGADKGATRWQITPTAGPHGAGVALSRDF